MHILFFFFFPFTFSQIHFSSSFPTPTRRILHQPFSPLDSSLPPSEPPSPPSSPNPKFPFSANSPPSPPAPTDSPFFPTVSAPPPPPPSPSNYASFPANISSLIVPHSETEKRGSNKLVALSIAAVVSALAVLAVAVFFYYYKRRKSSRSEFSDDKTFRSESSSRFFASVGGGGNAVVERAQKLRTGPSSGGASSEFLYLGTLVDSRRIEEVSDSSRGRKLESPEIHPLPPLLARRSGGIDSVGVGNATDVTSTADEEDEFYSPRGSIGTGSGSRRAFAAVAERMRDSSTSPSPPSSPATSLDRSESIIYSPPLTFTSTRPEIKISPPPPPQPPQNHYALSSPAMSPEQIHSARSPSASSPISSSPERAVNAGSGKASPSPPSSASSASEIVSAMNSLAASLHTQSRSPTLSASSSTRESPKRAPEVSAEQWLIVSPGRDSDKNSDETSSISNDSVLSALELDPPSRRSLSPYPSPSPGRDAEESRNLPPQVSVVVQESDRKRLSPSPSLSSSSSSSPARAHVAFTKKSPSLSSESSRNHSPERQLAEKKDESPGISDASEGILFELDPKKQSLSSPPSHERDLHNNSDASTCSESNDSDRSAESSLVRDSKPPSLAVPAPPPLPPPPTHFLRRQDSHSPRLATPPALTPPSRPFVIQSPANLSIPPVELPPPLLSGSALLETVEDTQKPKLKPLHWDKVRASSDREMVWDQLRTSSFKLNEEMIETLFVVKTPNSKPKETTPRSGIPWPNSENRVLDPKKSQNIAIALRALNVTIEEVCEALLEGNADVLGNEVLESLLKMSPTKEEERKLMEYKDDSPVKLGPAERFLKAVLDVPFAFKRVEAMLYISNFDSEVDYLKKSFETLENGCEELRSSRMFMKLLEAVLKTGNRMNVGTNRGDAHAFKLDTLLKLADVKGADGKTTLLHFVVQEIIRTEGARFAGPAEDDAKLRRVGLEVVSSLSSDLGNVKKAAAMDSDVLSGDVAKLSRGIGAIREAVARVGEERFSGTVEGFARAAEGEILRIQAQESVALSLVKEITEYFHGNSAKEEAHPFRIFMVVRDFLSVLDRVCKEVGMINERTMVSSAHRFPVPVNPMLAQVLPTPKKPYSSSDEEDAS